jgi:hypothetical protein
MSHRSWETTPRLLVSKDSERTSGAVRVQRRPRSQVVPRSIVLTLDQLAEWPEWHPVLTASRSTRTRMLDLIRVGKAGSVRLG